MMLAIESQVRSRRDGLEAQLASRRNNFNIIRLFLAIFVCFDHAGLVWSGQVNTELIRIGDLTLGFLAVNGFFILSGILITRSIERRGAGLDYFVSRLFRLYPALIVLALVSIFIIGPIVATGEYWTGLSVLSYASEILRFGNTTGSPNGFYPENPYPLEYNSPLWTLRYELLCYLAAPLILIIAGRFRRWTVIVLTILLGLLSAVFPPHTGSVLGNDVVAAVLRFGFCFSLGACIWQLRNFVWGQFHWVFVSAVVFLASLHFGVAIDAAATVFVAAVVLWLGLARFKFGSAMQDTDISYGVYIWHYPLMQILMGEGVAQSSLQLLILGLIAVFPIAWLSWIYVEKKALRHKPVFTPAP